MARSLTPADVRSRLAELGATSGDGTTAAFDEMTAAISLLQKYVADSTLFLSQYDIKSALEVWRFCLVLRLLIPRQSGS
jgi:hypothetical protein